jgi:glucan phosphoethanolaminetransferase (alkaline phosphatase superfamily)
MKKIGVFKIIIIVSCIIGLAGLFLPYEKSIGDYRKYLKDNPTSMNLEEVNFKNSDVVDISIVENFKVYKYAMSNSNDDWMQGESIINVVITIALIIFIILTLLFASLSKPVLTIIFSALMGISSILMNYDIVDRGVIPSSKYTYGISYYLYIAISILIIVSSIVIIVKKKKEKKNVKN